MRLSRVSTRRSISWPRLILAIALPVAFLAALSVLPAPVAADSASDIQQKIDATNAQIAQLEKEIAQYESALTDIGTQKNTLQSTVNTLDLSRKKMSTDISVTQNQITKTTLELSQLGGAITDKQSRIDTGKAVVADSLRTQNAVGNTTLVEILLSGNGLVEAWEDYDKLVTLESSLRT